MLGVTLFGIFLTPVFFYVIQWVNDLRANARAADTIPLAPARKTELSEPAPVIH
jgi:hypothetical protein